MGNPFATPRALNGPEVKNLEAIGTGLEMVWELMENTLPPGASKGRAQRRLVEAYEAARTAMEG